MAGDSSTTDQWELMASSRHLLACVLIAIALWLYSCASQGSVYGGPRDETPPQVLVDKSSTNYQIRYSEREIILYFDEFVVVKNALKEIVVSPPLVYLPQIEHKGKRVTFRFNEQEDLKPNVTYSINFGKAIRDFNEGNELENYVHVFSTGDYIDSLSIRGTVVDGSDGKPVSDMLVMLYQELRDSMPFLERPFYATRSDKEGRWQINNIKEDTFKLFALLDENVNYLFDLPTEKIAPYDSLLYIDTSRSNDPIELLAFVEDQQLAVTDVLDKRKGVVKIVVNRSDISIAPRWVDERPSDIVIDQRLDTVYLYYSGDTTLTKKRLVVGQDTITVGRPRSNSAPPTLRLTGTTPIPRWPLRPSDTISISTSTPITTIEPDSIQLIDTSGTVHQLDIVGLQPSMTVKLLTPTRQHLDYRLVVYPGAMTDLYGQRNTDTIRYNMTVAVAEKSGTLSLNLAPLLRDSVPYIATLKLAKDIIATYRTSLLADSIITLTYMRPGAYTIDLIKDINDNGRQDAGSYMPRRYQEEEKTVQLQPLKADWTLESAVAWQVMIPEDTVTVAPIAIDTISGDQPSPTDGIERR